MPSLPPKLEFSSIAVFDMKTSVCLICFLHDCTFRSSCTRKPPRNIIYRNHKIFNAQDFLNDLETNLTFEKQASTCVSCDKLSKKKSERRRKRLGQSSSIHDKRTK